jgi:NADP-dependent 3-hydroxy acid dehydrogenase YdfG
MKKVLITGATSGFGRACALYYAERGYYCIVTGRRTERLEELSQEIESKFGKGKVEYLTHDVRDRESVFNDLAKYDDLDILVNNAGLALGLEPAYETNTDDWDAMVQTNINGLIYCTRAVLPSMVKRKKGHIINIGSIAGTHPYPGANVYGATKAFVRQFSLNLRSDLQGTNIRVTNVEPGMAESEFSIVRFKGNEDAAGKVYENTKPLTPKDIAEIVYWVSSVPEHVNINAIEVMPTCQAWGPFSISRDE